MFAYLDNHLPIYARQVKDLTSEIKLKTVRLSNGTEAVVEDNGELKVGSTVFTYSLIDSNSLTINLNVLDRLKEEPLFSAVDLKYLQKVEIVFIEESSAIVSKPVNTKLIYIISSTYGIGTGNIMFCVSSVDPRPSFGN